MLTTAEYLLGFLIGIGILLFFYVIYILYKLLLLQFPSIDLRISLMNAAPWLFALFAVFALATITYFTLRFAPLLLPISASEHGDDTDYVFSITLWITGITFLITQTLLFYFIFKYKKTTGSIAVHMIGNAKWELWWTGLPMAVFLLLFAYGEYIWAKSHSIPARDCIHIEIMAEQFNWRVRYPGKDNQLGRYQYKLIDQVNDFGIDFTDLNSEDDFEPLQLHIPVGVPVMLHIRSRDVIHSVFMPHFRLKMDAVPGMPTSFIFRAKYTTAEMRDKLQKPDFNYEMACAELCGRMHFAMLMLVIVDTPEEYQRWLKSQKSWLISHPGYKKKSGCMKPPLATSSLPVKTTITIN